MTSLLRRRSQACQRCCPTAPLAAWPVEADLDGRITAGDPVAYFDAVVEAIEQLEAVRDALDRLLTDPSGPFVHGKGSAGRLRELAARAAAGNDLFETGSGRDGHRPDAPCPPAMGVGVRCR